MKKGFTLAEVLITLGIVGVVAAMTMPGLITRYEEKVLLTQFKKVYSTLFQAYNMAYQEYGRAKDWDVDNTEEGRERIYNILSPHLKIAHNWGNKPARSNKLVYKDLPGNIISYQFIAFYLKSYNFSLSDGTMIGITWDNEVEMPILQVDINGFKGPNQIGKDYFILCLNSKKGSPFITGFPKWWTLWPSVCTTKAKGEGETGWWRGGACANWVIATGNMDYLHRELSREEWVSVIKLLVIDAGDEELE